MIVFNENFMNFLCEVNKLTKGQYYVAFENTNDDVIFIDARTGNYSRVAYSLCLRYLHRPKQFLNDLL